MAVRPTTDPAASRVQPPQSAEAERAVLGAILKSSDALSRVVEVLQDPLDFYSPRHQMIYRTVLDLYERSEPCDYTTVSIALSKAGILEKIGGRAYLVELAEEVASTGNVAAYAATVLETGVLRRLIAASNEISDSCYAQELPAEELLDRAESNIFRLSESRLRKGFTPIKLLVAGTLQRIDSMQVSEGGLSGMPTGFFDLDARTLGLHRGDLVVIAGRPSMGKTALALNIAESLATCEKDRKTIGIFSLEMSKEALVLRMLCGRARLNQHKVRSGKLTDQEWSRLPIAGEALSAASIHIDDSPTLTPLEMRAKARRLKAQHGLDMVVVDYIQLMHSTSRSENRQQEISLITRNLKSLAKELDIPVVALSQLSRAVEQRTGDKRPQLADLRESGAIEQDADLVLLLYREEFYRSHLDRNDPKYKEVEGQAEVIIAKQRNGPTGTVRLSFLSELARFENLEKQRPDLPSGVEPVGSGSEMPF
jgi:replicative DNA helicase